MAWRNDNAHAALRQTIISHATDDKNSSMSYRLPPLSSLRAFEAAARHLSFKNAAQEFSVTPTAISHQIKTLEDYLNQELFVRLTRSLELTPQGQAMLPKVREGLECFAAAVESAVIRSEQGRLVVMLPPSFATRWLVPRLRGFAQARPALNLQVMRALSTIDGYPADGAVSFDAVDLREEDSMVVIRFGHGDYPGYHVERMFGSDYIAVCSPKLLEGEHPLRNPADMVRQVLLHDDTTNEWAGPSWEEWFRLAGLTHPTSQAGPHFSDSGMVYVAALDGLGVALASKPLVATALAQGRLVAPFDIAVAQQYAYYLVTPKATAQRPAVVAFRQWLLQEAQAQSVSAAAAAHVQVASPHA